jgi:hypothetical protein
MARKNSKWSKDRFIQIPHPILKSIAYTNCGAWARTLLIELILQFNGKNNGDLSAPYSLMKTRGFNSSGTLSKASKELENNGITEITKHHRNTGTNYEMTKLVALTWLPIDECTDKFGNYKLEVNATTSASNKWKLLEPLPDLEQSKKNVEIQRKNQVAKEILSIQKDYGN